MKTVMQPNIVFILIDVLYLRNLPTTDFYPTALEAAGLPLLPDQHHDGLVYENGVQLTSAYGADVPCRASCPATGPLSASEKPELAHGQTLPPDS